MTSLCGEWPRGRAQNATWGLGGRGGLTWGEHPESRVAASLCTPDVERLLGLCPRGWTFAPQEKHGVLESSVPTPGAPQTASRIAVQCSSRSARPTKRTQSFRGLPSPSFFYTSERGLWGTEKKSPHDVETETGKRKTRSVGNRACEGKTVISNTRGHSHPQGSGRRCNPKQKQEGIKKKHSTGKKKPLETKKIKTEMETKKVEAEMESRRDGRWIRWRKLVPRSREKNEDKKDRKDELRGPTSARQKKQTDKQKRENQKRLQSDSRSLPGGGQVYTPGQAGHTKDSGDAA